MSERSSYNPGEFCWVDLASTDFEGAKKFYGELIGWEWEEAGPAEEVGGYGFFTYKGKQVCGGGPVQAPGQPSAWSSYVKVADADESAAKVKEAGGSVIAPPFELPSESGRMAVCQDPEGAFFCVMQQREHHGAELVNEIGAWTWNQLVTRDLDKAKEFYGAVFGWDLTKASDEAGAEPFFMWQVEDQEWEEGLAGAMAAGSEIPAEVPAHWQVYFCVASADDAVKATNDGGGQVMVPVTEIPVGKLAMFTDPEGAALGVLEPNYPEDR